MSYSNLRCTRIILCLKLFQSNTTQSRYSSKIYILRLLDQMSQILIQAITSNLKFQKFKCCKLKLILYRILFLHLSNQFFKNCLNRTQDRMIFKLMSIYVKNGAKKYFKLWLIKRDLKSFCRSNFFCRFLDDVVDSDIILANGTAACGKSAPFSADDVICTERLLPYLYSDCELTVRAL